MSAVVEQQGGTPQTVGAGAAVGLTIVVAWLALGAGLVMAAFAVMGQLDTAVPVALGPGTPAYSTGVVPCVEGWPADGLSACGPAAPAGVWPGGEPLPVQPAGGMVASADGVAPLPALLSTAPQWIGLTATGAVILVLVPVLRCTAAGRLFRAGNARRLVTAAAVIVLAWVSGIVGPALAAPTIIGLIEAAPRYTQTGAVTEFAVPTGWLVFDLRFAWWPLLPALLLAGLAGATRAGTRITTDTEGLV